VRTVARSPIAPSSSDFGSLRSYLVRRDLRDCPHNIQAAEDQVRGLARNEEGKLIVRRRETRLLNRQLQFALSEIQQCTAMYCVILHLYN